jgi:tRNA (guanine37-N1)-methyltransferase
MLNITILTLFPSFFDSFLANSIIARAISKGTVTFKIVNIRDYTLDKHHRVDDRPAGGGAGLIMKMQPICDCLAANRKPESHVVLLSPEGSQYNQQKAIALAKETDLVLICGHYEGIDYRFNKKVDEQISIGDYVLTGGEIGAMAIADSVVRLLKGSIADDSTKEESFNNGLLEYPQYTLPYSYEGEKIPEILFSGNHTAIEIFHQREALRLTKELRPDLFKRYQFTKADLKRLHELESGTISKTEALALEKGKRFIEAEIKKDQQN